MDAVRILHVVSAMGRGGMESRIMDLYRHIDRDRYQYDFYIETGKKSAFDDEITALGGRVFYNESSLKYNLPNFRAFSAFLKLHPEYKVVYAYNQWAGHYLKQAKECGVPFRIASARTSLDTVTMKNTVKSLIKRNVNTYATHKFAVSKKAANWLFGARELRSGNVKIWPNAIDTRQFAFSGSVRENVRKKLGIGDEITVMHVGNVRALKNHPFLLRTFAEFKKSSGRAKLVLVGEGVADRFSDLAKELGIEDSVLFLGSRNDVPELLQAGDVFVFPSLYEGFPGAVLEAEASGQWCFISDSITDEVVLTDHIMMLPLSYGEARWAQIIAEKYGPVNREEAYKKVKAAGYDIDELTAATMSFYDKLVDEKA